MKLRREITKQKPFNESKLRINLPKFSGYESKLEIYSFQSEFLKICEQTTPKQMMLNLLNNNLLEGSALLLVKSITGIEDIWNLLRSKIATEEKIITDWEFSQLWKIRDQKQKMDGSKKLNPACGR